MMDKYSHSNMNAMGIKLKLIPFFLAMMVALTAAIVENVWAVSGYTTDFNAMYGTSGARGLNTLGSCITCHPGALNGSSTLNAYANDWLMAAHNFSAIESIDSDGDGYGNLAEIQSGTFPGDQTSSPSPPTGSAPVANAGIDQNVSGNVVVMLDGSASSDADGTIVTYNWLQTGGPVVVLSNAAAAQPTFTAPAASATTQTLTFELTVTDNSGLQGTDLCIVTIASGNQPPVADAGLDQNVAALDPVTLDGSGSSDPDGQIVAYQWVQTSGSTVSLANAFSAQTTFTAPGLSTGSESLTFTLTVTDDAGSQAEAVCIVNVVGNNQPPVADGGGNLVVDEGTTITLDGSASFDADDGISAYLWEQVGTGTPVMLSDPTDMQPTFVTPIVDPAGMDLTFRLTVRDASGLLSTDLVVVTVLDNGITLFPANILPMMTTAGAPIGVGQVLGGTMIKLEAMPTPAQAAPLDLRLGLLDLSVIPNTPGGKVTVTIHLPEPAPAGYHWFKYNPMTQVWTDYTIATNANFDTGAVFNATRDQVTITLIDGGMGDDDGLPDGIITDPSGLGATSALAQEPASNTFGPTSSGGGCFIDVLDADALSWQTLLSLGLVLLLVVRACFTSNHEPGQRHGSHSIKSADPWQHFNTLAINPTAGFRED